MPFPSFNSVQEFTASAGGQIQQFVSYLFGFLSKEHKDDGSHGAITGDSLTLTGNIASTAPSPQDVHLFPTTQAAFLVQTTHATPIMFGTNGQTGWGVSAAHDWAICGPFGVNTGLTLVSVVDSVGAPTLSGVGFGTGADIEGGATDYGFTIRTGSGSTTATGNVTFGHGFHGGATPSLTLGSGWTTTENLKVTSITTTGMTIATVSGGNFPTGALIYVLVRGY